MSNFKDFDLDLKKVSVAGTNATATTTSIPCDVTGKTITMTLNGKCNSVEQPTTGVTVACCAGYGDGSELNCV